jgi:hypothetical protein
VRFVSATAIVTACGDCPVLVFNHHGHFFVPHLEPGRTYEFIAHNGEASKRWRFTPRRGHNELEVEVRTRPARPARPTARRRGQRQLQQRQAGA